MRPEIGTSFETQPAWQEWRRKSSIRRFLSYAKLQTMGVWFDVTNNVSTTTFWPERLEKNRDPSYHPYVPTPPDVVTKILRDLPIENHSNYTFVDFGSGKGRMLFLAAELPFQSIEGIEFDGRLHACALNNLTKYKKRVKNRSSQIQCWHLDALHYDFPVQNLVVYIFNSFGEEIMREVLSNLGKSLAEHPRDVFVVMFYPEYGYVAEREPLLKAYKKTSVCHIYRSCIL